MFEVIAINEKGRPDKELADRLKRGFNDYCINEALKSTLQSYDDTVDFIREVYQDNPGEWIADGYLSEKDEHLRSNSKSWIKTLDSDRYQKLLNIIGIKEVI